MKKYLILFIPLIILTSCTKQEVINETISTTTVPTTTIPPYIDDNPITIGLYQYGKLVTDYSAKFINHTELGVFDVYFTNEPNVGNYSTKYNYNKYYNQYNNIEDYKIGFYIKFYVNDNLYEKVILDPSAKHSMTPYLYNYLYDDIHQTDGARYSHLEPEDMKENTIFSSIKIYSAQQGEEMTSDITLTVFTYKNENDFDNNGYYRGNSKYTITIKRR